MLEELMFWGNSKLWPPNAMGHIFLARAIDDVGRKLFRGEWVSTEPMPPLPLVLYDLPQYLPRPEVVNATRELKAAVFLCLDEAKVAFSPEAISTEQWQMGLDLLGTKEAAQIRSNIRMTDLMNYVRQNILDGQLRYGLRAIQGGDIVVGNPAHWNTENLSSRFKLCRMNPTSPFANSTDGGMYIYLNSDDLARLINDRGGHFPVSPTISQTLVSSHEDERLTSTQKEIDEAVKSIWPDGRVPRRVADRNSLIQTHMSTKGLTPPNERTIRRYFQAVQTPDGTGQKRTSSDT